MAIYHLNLGYVSRSTGRSTVQSASYITGEKLHETRRHLEVHYKHQKSAIVWRETFAPDYLSDDFKNVVMWDAFESFEDTYALKRFPNNIQARKQYENQPVRL